MRLSFRKLLAALLWIAALVPPALYLGSLSSPAATLEFADRAFSWLRFLGISLLGIGVALLLIYPPFLPYMRMSTRRIWRRLGTDHKPLYDGLYRLKHLETHADHLQVGRAARNIGEMGLAVAHLGRAFEMDPSHLSGRYDLARVLCDVGQHAQAAQLLETVVKEDEQHGYGDALHLLGLCQARTGDPEQAAQTLRQQQQLFPGNRRVHLLLAQVLAKTGDKEGSKAELEQAARPPKAGERLGDKDALARAQARVAQWRGGRFS